MARQQANKGDKGGLVSRSSMERIGRAVAAYERGDRNRKPQAMPRAWEEPDPIQIGRTTSEWVKGELATITLYDAGEPNDESTKTPPETLEGCVNRFATVQPNKWVALARAVNGGWYLIAAEC